MVLPGQPVGQSREYHDLFFALYWLAPLACTSASLIGEVVGRRTTGMVKGFMTDGVG